MLKIYLTKGDHEQGVWVTLPYSPTGLGEAYAALDDIDSSELDIRIRQAESSVYNLPEFLIGAAIDNGNILNELDFLAKRIDALTDKEQDIFSAAMDIEPPHSVQEIVNLSCNLDKYELFPDIFGETELGKYILKREGMKVPANLDPYLDYEMVAGRYRNNHPGAFSDYGFVVKKNEPLEVVYDGQTLPDPNYEKSSIFKLHLYVRSKNGQYPNACILNLPASEERLQHTLKSLDISKFEDCSAISGCSRIDGLYERLPPGCSVSELNGFAKIANRILTNGEASATRLLAALEAEVPSCMAGAVEIAENLRLYELLPDDIKTAEDYADYALSGAGIFIDDEIAEFVDYEAYGRSQMQEDDVRQTAYGLVKRTDNHFFNQFPSELHTMRLFSPLYPKIYRRSEWGDIENEPEDITAVEAVEYEDKIRAEIERSRQRLDSEHGLAAYFDNVLLKRRVHSAHPTIENYRGELWGVTELQIHGELTQAELHEAIQEIEGQYSDGWGEGLEQQPIKVPDGELQISLWDNGNDFFIKPEHDLKNQPEQELGSQGGMNLC